MSVHRGKCLVQTVMALSFFAIGLDSNAHEQHMKHAESLHVAQNELSLTEINNEYLSSVKLIFQKSCFDCHSSQTKYPWYSNIPGVRSFIESDIKEARTHLDLSNDFPFSGHGTPVTDFEAIRDQINEGAMPPKRYSFLHPGSKLTNEEKEVILKWIVDSLSTISAPGESDSKHGH